MRGGRGGGGTEEKAVGPREVDYWLHSSLQASPPPGLRRGLPRASVPSLLREGWGGGGSRGARAPWQGRTYAPRESAPGLRSGRREFLASKSPIEAAPWAQLLRIEALWRDSALFVPLGFACFCLSAGRRGSQAPGAGARVGLPTRAGRPEAIPVTPARGVDGSTSRGIPAPAPQLHSQGEAIPAGALWGNRLIPLMENA